MNMQKKMFFLLSLSLSFTTACWANIKIKAPATIGSGGVVPVTFSFFPELSKGEAIIVIIENKEAIQVMLQQGTVSSFGTRFRMHNSGPITVHRIVDNKVIETSSVIVKVTVGAKGSGEPSALKNHKKKFRLKIKKGKGTLKALFQTRDKNKFGFDDVLVLKDNNFKIEIKGSNLISKNPFIHIDGSFSKKLVTTFNHSLTKKISTTIYKDISYLSALQKPLTKEKLQKNALAKKTVEKRSEKQILSGLASIQKDIDTLLTEWLQYQNKPFSDLGRRAHQTKMVEYARDEIPSLIDDSGLLNSALMLLKLIDTDDTKNYAKWDRNFSKPIRKILGDGIALWDYGFNNDTQSKVHAAYGSSSYTDPFTHAKIRLSISHLMTYQYDWVQKNRKDTSADTSIVLPSGISGGKAKFTYKEPVRIRARLETPTELFFEGIGKQVGEGTAVFLSYKGQLAEFERRIKDSRKAYFNCYPKCKDFNENSQKISRLLIEKDVHFLKLAGRYNPLTDRLDRGLSALIEVTGTKQGSSLLDGGVPRRCKGMFDDWGYYYSQANDSTIVKQTNRTYAALGTLIQGNTGALRKLGSDNHAAQQLAFQRTAHSYGLYQLCRDQWEFDNWEDKHGELKEESSWFGFFRLPQDLFLTA